MKKLIFFFALFPLMLGAQVQNSKLAEKLLLSVGEPLPGAAITSGTPTTGVTYTMGHVGASSDFAASGAPSTANGVTFKADGDAPGAWDGAILRPINASALNLPTCQNLTNTGAIPTYGHKGSSSYLAFDGVDDYVPISVPAFGTGDFSFIIRMRRNLAFHSYEGYFAQATGDSDFGFASDANGFRFEIGNGVGSCQYFALTNLTASSVVGNWEDISISVSRTGNVKSYLNGVLKDDIVVTLSTSVSIAITNFMLGYFWAGAMNGSISSCQIFNYALDAAGVTYYSNPANHLKAVDQSPIGTVLTSGTIVTGKRYRIIDWITTDDFVNIGGANVDGTEFTATGTTPTTWTNSSTVTQLGCVLSLTPESFISPTLIRDYYHSVDITLSGATAPRLVRGELSAWRMTGASKMVSSALMTQALGATDRTMIAWVNPSVLNSGMVLCYGTSASHGGMYFFVYADGSIYFGDDGSTVSSISIVSTNTWSHIAVVYSNGYVKFYINGVLSRNVAFANINTVSGYVYSGVYLDGSSNYFNGIIEQPRIYGYAMSAETVALDYSVFQ